MPASANWQTFKDAEEERLDEDALTRLSFGITESTCSAAAKEYASQDNVIYPTDFAQAVADDWTYVAWVWRLEGGADKNHSVSAMKSRDLKSWYNLCGAPITLPVTPQSLTVIDPVGPESGLHNGRLFVSFDPEKRAVITYQKNADKQRPDGSIAPATQVFNARREGSVIRIFQMTNWDSLDAFSGVGSLPPRDTAVGFGGLRITPSGTVAQTFSRSIVDNDKCQAVETRGEACSSFPRTGTYAIELADASGKDSLHLKRPLTTIAASALASDDPYENPPTSPLSVGPLENAPLSQQQGAVGFQIRTLKSRTENRWITVRGDFDGDGWSNRGLFDRYNSRFIVDDGTERKTIALGRDRVCFGRSSVTGTAIASPASASTGHRRALHI